MAGGVKQHRFPLRQHLRLMNDPHYSSDSGGTPAPAFRSVGVKLMWVIPCVAQLPQRRATSAKSAAVITVRCGFIGLRQWWFTAAVALGPPRGTAVAAPSAVLTCSGGRRAGFVVQARTRRCPKAPPRRGVRFAIQPIDQSRRLGHLHPAGVAGVSRVRHRAKPPWRVTR